MKQMLVFAAYMLSCLAFLVIAAVVCLSVTLFPKRFYCPAAAAVPANSGLLRNFDRFR